MAVSAVGALISTVSYSTAAGFAFAGFSAFATNFVLGAALNALTPKPSIGQAGASRGYQVNTRGSALDHQIIYGEVRVGGAVVYDEATGTDNKYLHRIIAVAGHEINSFEEIYINDEVATIDGSGNVTSPSQYSGKIRINTHLGASDQLADADLVAESAKWTSAHRLRGIAYMYVRMEFDADAFPNGVPTFTATVKGKKVYNPDTDTTAWSDNPALCLRDYLISNYGLAEDTANIDDTLVNAAVTVCNQTNTDAGTTRYTCNGAFTTDLTPYDVINNLLTSMGGTLWYAQGKWRMKPAYWTAPVLDLNEDDLRSSIGVATRHSRRDNFNVVKGTFRGEESNWQTTDYPQVENAAFLAADNGQESVADVDLPFTDNSIEARRLARIALESNRQQLTVTGSFGLKTMQVQVGDNVRLTNTRFGWTNKEFEVLSWNFGLTDGLDLQVELTLRETAESVFDEVDDGIVYERDNTNLPNPFDGLTVSNLAVNGGGKTQSDGTFISSAILTWDAVDSAFISHYEVEWKPLADSNYASTTTVGNSIELSPIIDAVEYVFRVRAITLLGNGGPIASITYTVGGDTTAPNAPTNVSAEAGYKYITVNFDLPTASDFNRVEVYEGTSTNFGGAVSIGFTSGNSFVRTGLGNAQTRYYWIRSEDHSGNNSAFVGPVNATTFLVEETDLTQSLIDTINAAGVTPVNSLPATGDFDGQIVFLLTDSTLYRWDEAGAAWSTELYTDIQDDSVTTDKLVASAVVASKIAAGAVTADKINVSELSAITADLGTIQVGTANIADAAITNAKISNLSADKITTGVLNADVINSDDITKSQSGSTAGNVTIGSNTNIQQLTVTTVGRPVDITFLCDVTGYVGVEFKLYRDGTLLATHYGGCRFDFDRYWTGSGFNFDQTRISATNTFSMGYSDTPSAGTYTYKVTATNRSITYSDDVFGLGTGIRNRYLKATEFRK